MKKPVTFRLSENLLAKLRLAAKSEHRSLNNYVECILMDASDNIPNETTARAIEEARNERHEPAFSSVGALMEELMR